MNVTTIAFRFASKKASSAAAMAAATTTKVAIKVPKTPKAPKMAVEPVSVKTVSVKKTAVKKTSAVAETISTPTATTSSTATVTKTNYNVYYAAQRVHLLSLNPTASLSDVRKQIQVSWANLSAEEKEKFTPAGATPAVPKRGVSGYNVFVRERFAKANEGTVSPTFSFKDSIGKVSAEWKVLSDAEKDVFHKKAETANASIVPVVKEATVKRPLTSFLLFSQEQRPVVVAANPTWKFAEIGIEIGRQWKALSKEQQAVYEKKHADLKAAAAALAASV